MKQGLQLLSLPSRNLQETMLRIRLLLCVPVLLASWPTVPLITDTVPSAGAVSVVWA